MAFNKGYVKDDDDHVTDTKMDMFSCGNLPTYDECILQINNIKTDSIYQKRTVSNGNMTVPNVNALSAAPKHYNCSIAKYLSCRWKVAYLALTGLILQVAHRNCISVALVCMTRSLFSNDSINGNVTVGLYKGYNWSPHVEGMILSAYFYGQIISPLISGVLCKYYSVKKLMVAYVLASSCLLIIIPWVSQYGAWTLIVVRGAQGFFGSGCLPMYTHLWSHWAPRQERSQLIAFTFSGLDIGVIVAFSVSGWLCTLNEGRGWPVIFYSFGALSLLWCAVWLFFITDNPDDHMYISEQEKKYIASNRANNVEKVSSTPWSKILSTPAVYAMMIGITSVALGITVVFSFLPKYMNDVLKYDIKENGFMSSLPFLGRAFSIIIIGKISDFLLNKKIFYTTTMRKINQCGAGVLGAALIIPVGFLSEGDSYVAVLLITLSAAALGGTMSGSYANILEIFPRHASSISGLAFGLNGIGQTVAPIVIGQMIKTGNPKEWLKVYVSIGAVYLFGALTYFLYGSSKSLDVKEDSEVSLEVKLIDFKTKSINKEIVYIISESTNQQL